MLHEIILLSIIHELVKRIEVRGAELKRILNGYVQAVQAFHVFGEPESARRT
ncbi:vesicle coat complex subunit [Bacillus pumilus]|jgi:hypothetical protein|nr:vesicle coat complex subunit [Bacillus pumilus]